MAFGLVTVLIIYLLLDARIVGRLGPYLAIAQGRAIRLLRHAATAAGTGKVDAVAPAAEVADPASDLNPATEDQRQVTAEPFRADSAFDLLICDCDGVIIDSEIVADRVLAELLRETYPDRDFTGLLAGSFGLKTRDILARLADHLGRPLPADFVERLRPRLWQALDRDARPVAGVREALLRVELPVAVASNSSEAWIATSVERAGLTARVAGRIFSADRVAAPKPAPDVYLLAAGSLGVAPARCLVVEDSETGVAAARAAGMTVIGFIGASHIPADHGARLVALGACRVLDHMAALPAAVAEFASPSLQAATSAGR